jgi:transposase
MLWHRRASRKFDCLYHERQWQGMYKEIKEFSTFTDGIQALGSWLREHEIIHVSIESTGVYWKPVFNILAEEYFDLMLVNAKHVKNVPGRKTDIKDSEWLCKLLKNGRKS